MSIVGIYFFEYVNDKVASEDTFMVLFYSRNIWV